MSNRVQRVAAYAVVVRQGEVLLSRLSSRVSRHELWTLPGGGLDHGEDPRDAVVREVREETGLEVTIGETARTYNLHQADSWRRGRRVDAHSLRIVYDGWVPADSPPPQVQEVDGSTADAAWHPLEAVRDGSLPTASLVREALGGYRPFRLQRVAAYGLVLREHPEPAVLLTRVSARGFHTGSWSLPGGGVDHGEAPEHALARELHEETGLAGTVGRVLTTTSETVRGTAPNGRDEELHSVGIVFAVTLDDDTAEPRLVEQGGTTDAVRWVPLGEVTGGLPVVEAVTAALGVATSGQRG